MYGGCNSIFLIPRIIDLDFQELDLQKEAIASEASSERPMPMLIPMLEQNREKAIFLKFDKTRKPLSCT